MSKDLINIDNFQLPAYLQNQEVTTSESLVTQQEALPRISIRGHRFRLKKDGEEKVAPAGQPLNIVVLAASPKAGTAKSFYATNYVSDSDDPPDCSSGDGVYPDSWVDLPVCSSCAKCPNNAWGSATDQDGQLTKGKACNDVKKLLVVSPISVEKGDIYVLQVPPTSLNALSSYGRQLSKHNVPVEGCVTSVDFVDSEFPQIEFKLGGFLDEANGTAAQARAYSDEVQDMIDVAPGGSAETTRTLPKSVQETIATEKAEAAQRMQETGSVFDDDVDKADLTPEEIEAKNDIVDLDKTGDAWNEELHSSTHSKTKDGKWVKRRNRGKTKTEATETTDAEQQTQTTEPGGFEQADSPPSEKALDDILKGDW